MTINEKLRSNFRERIESERRVLNLVNRYYKKHHLHGLSESSISDWAMHLSEINEETVSMLLKISLRLRLDYNVSNEMFSESNGAPVPKLDSLLALLENNLSAK